MMMSCHPSPCDGLRIEDTSLEVLGAEKDHTMPRKRAKRSMEEWMFEPPWSTPAPRRRFDAFHHSHERTKESCGALGSNEIQPYNHQLGALKRRAKGEFARRMLQTPHLRRDATDHSARTTIPSCSLGDMTGVLHVDMLLLKCLRGCQSCFLHRSINAHGMPSRFVRRRRSAAELGVSGPWTR